MLFQFKLIKFKLESGHHIVSQYFWSIIQLQVPGGGFENYPFWISLNGDHSFVEIEQIFQSKNFASFRTKRSATTSS